MIKIAFFMYFPINIINVFISISKLVSLDNYYCNEFDPHNVSSICVILLYSAKLIKL